ncbi:Rieske [2Fe-2S] iron-sulfur domain protein, partial [mine drainage metagenome]
SIVSITIYNSSKSEIMKWYVVGKTTSLKEGDIAKVNLNRMEIIIMKVKGDYFATSHLCSHENYDLAEGFIDDGTLICPNHFATFNPKTGEVISPPEGAEEISPLKSFKTKVENGEILVEA